MRTDKTSSVGQHCRYCTDKYEACHDYCELYLDAVAKEKERREQIRQAKYKEQLYDGYHKSVVSRQIRIKERNKKV